MAGFARYAELIRAEDEARAADRPVRAAPPESRSPAEQWVRHAMAAAERDAPWGSPGYGATFWRVMHRLLGARLVQTKTEGDRAA